MEEAVSPVRRSNEDGKMEVDNEKKVDQRQREIAKQLLKIEELMDLAQDSVEEHKESCVKSCSKMSRRVMTSCQNTKRCRRCRRSCRFCKTTNCSVTRVRASLPRGMSSSRLRRRECMQKWQTQGRRFKQNRSMKRNWTGNQRIASRRRQTWQ